MTPEPTRGQPPPAIPNIVGLVKRDVGRAVRDAATATSSPYFGHAHLHADLERLRERLALLEQRRPDLLAQVADHFHVPPTAQDVAAAAHDLGHRLLDRRYLQPDAHVAAPGGTSPARDAGTVRLRASTDQHLRTPPGRAAGSHARPRR